MKSMESFRSSYTPKKEKRTPTRTEITKRTLER